MFNCGTIWNSKISFLYLKMSNYTKVYYKYKYRYENILWNVCERYILLWIHKYYDAINSTEIFFSSSLSLFLSLYILTYIWFFFSNLTYINVTLCVCSFIEKLSKISRRIPKSHSDNPCAQSCSITSSSGNCEVTISRWEITYPTPWVLYMYKFLYCIKIHILYS